MKYDTPAPPDRNDETRQSSGRAGDPWRSWQHDGDAGKARPTAPEQDWRRRGRSTIPPTVDLAHLTRKVRHRMPASHDPRLARGMLRRIVTRILGCSEPFGEDIVLRMERRGFVRFDDRGCSFSSEHDSE